MRCNRGDEKSLGLDESEDEVVMHVPTCHITIPISCVLEIEKTGFKSGFVVCGVVMDGCLLDQGVHFVVERTVEEFGKWTFRTHV
jgi:hypothetical protein